MFRVIIGSVIAVILFVAFAHFKYDSFASNTNRINAAVPLSYDAQQMLARLRRRGGGKLPAELNKDYSERLEARANRCIAGAPQVVTPTLLRPEVMQGKPLINIGFFTTPGEIQHAIGDSKCFSDADFELTNWLGAQVLALYLADPPLRPLPSNIPALYPFKASGPEDVFSATRAGVLLIKSTDFVTLVDASDGTVIRQAENSEAGRTEGLSPNGQVYAVSHEDRIDFKESSTGDVLATSLVCQYATDCGFQWVDQRSILTYADSRRASVIHDIRNGHLAAFPGATDAVMALTDLPEMRDTYLGITRSEVIRFKFVYFRETPAISTDGIKQAAQKFGPVDRGGLTADGVWYVHSVPEALYITNSATLETQTVPLEPFLISRSILTADPNQILVLGAMKNAPDQELSYLYSISSQSFAPLDSARLPTGQFVYLKGLKKLALVTDKEVRIADPLATQPAIDIATFRAQIDQSFHAKQSELLALHQTEQRAVKDAQYADLSAPTGVDLAQGSVLNHADITALAGDAAIAGVGVLHALGAGDGSRQTVTTTTTMTTTVINGRVMMVPRQQVQVRSGTPSVRVVIGAGRKLIVVLAAAEHVRWNIQIEPGAHVKAILLSGRGGSEIDGQGATPVVNMGSAAPADTSSPQYDALQSEVMDWTGKKMSQFQGMSESSRFQIGG